MKQHIYLTFLVLALYFLSGCGLQSQLNELKVQESRNARDIEDLQNRVAALEVTTNNNIKLLNDNAILLATMQNFYNSLSSKEGSDAASLQAQITSLTSTVSGLQTTVTAQVSNIVTLQTNENITAFHDFCGTKAGVYNEIGMVTSSGKIVAYFENGSSRFLSVLKDGSYITSDGTACYFTVSGNGTVISNEHY